jgi:hypothetical protein
MRTKPTWLFGGVVMVALGLTLMGPALAQTTTTVAERNFEVIAVDGNTLVVRNDHGTEEYTVPDDFRFTIDGKKMSVRELKVGMKGTATVTTTVTVKPVVVTEVREGQVLRASDLSVTVRMADGSTRRFTQGELDKRGVEIFKDGQPVRLAGLKRGDPLTATIVTNGPPVLLTDQEVQATLAEAKAEPAMAQAASPASAPPAAPAPPNAAEPKSTPAAVSAPSAADAKSAPAQSPGLGLMWYLLIAVVVVVALLLFMRRGRAP